MNRFQNKPLNTQNMTKAGKCKYLKKLVVLFFFSTIKGCRLLLFLWVWGKWWLCSPALNLPPVSVNPRDQQGRRSRNPKAPRQTGAKNSRGNSVNLCRLCFIVYIFCPFKKIYCLNKLFKNFLESRSRTQVKILPWLDSWAARGKLICLLSVCLTFGPLSDGLS